MVLYIRYTYVCMWSVRIYDICIFWLTWYVLDHIRFTAFQTYFLSLASFLLSCDFWFVYLYLFHFFPTFCSFPALFFLLSWPFWSSYCTRIDICYMTIYSGFFYHWTTLSSPFLFPFSLPLPFSSLLPEFFLPFIQFHLLNSIQFCAPLQAACDFPRFIPLSTHVLNYPRWRELCNWLNIHVFARLIVMATIFFHVSLNVSAVVAVSTAVCASVCVCVCVCMSHAIGTTSAQRKHELQMHLRALFTRPAPPPPARMRHMPHAAHATRRHPQLLMFSSSSSTPFLSDNYNIYTARERKRAEPESQSQFPSRGRK